MMRSIYCCLLCCAFALPVWAINVKVQSRVMPRCMVSGKSPALVTSAALCSQPLPFVRLFKRVENSGASAVERVVMEF
ncbi:hypothetical protein [Iodobacter ciconiae]|uniref:Secreted protein n=1 Tax=Iodobacter ciconiae TaxID=2496266 RepID=A0A3S8ZSC8_9NEIS|nr:hypothetical protein [Iodobacter ciconiae]AZN36368.1 hypothetical protein EJO50_07615 [Iodobacter ciconiae]